MMFSNYFWRMVRQWADVLVEVQGFLVGLRYNLVVFDQDSEVQEVHRLSFLHEFPSQNAKVVCFLFEFFPGASTWFSNSN